MSGDPADDKIAELCSLIGAPDICGCWIWLGSANSTNRGNFHLNGKNSATHAVYRLFVGDVSDNLWMLHNCHRGHLGCVNPDHMEPGTAPENARQRILQGRGTNQKLWPSDIYYMRDKFEEGVSNEVLAKKFNISVSTVQSIRTGHRWGWLPPKGK